jgi:hypothetical protein
MATPRKPKSKPVVTRTPDGHYLNQYHAEIGPLSAKQFDSLVVTVMDLQRQLRSTRAKLGAARRELAGSASISGPAKP